jgi:hypothetical protein
VAVVREISWRPCRLVIFVPGRNLAISELACEVPGPTGGLRAEGGNSDLLPLQETTRSLISLINRAGAASGQSCLGSCRHRQ